MKKRILINDELTSELVVVGADDKVYLSDAIDRIAKFLRETPDARLCDVAFTAGTEAKGMAAKIAIVADSVPDLLEKLEMAKRRLDDGRQGRNAFSKGVYLGTETCPAPGRTVFLFPGEGSQYPDMLRDLTLHFPACRAAFDASDTAVASCSPDLNIAPKNVFLPSKWIFPTAEAADSAPPAPLGLAPSILSVLAADNAMLFLFQQLGIAPDAVLGLGVGEIPALECAGAIPVPDKRRRVHALGEGYRMIAEIDANNKLLRPCVSLSVAGIGRQPLEDALVPLGGQAVIAAEQAPELFTVVAAENCISVAEDLLAQAGASARRLQINKPFHTPLMKPAEKMFRDYYASLVKAGLSLPAYSCCTGDKLPDDPAALAEAAASQWWSPLSITRAIEKLYDDGYRVFVELGARGVLSTCVAATLRHKPHLALAVNRGHRPDMLQFHHTLAALVSHGHDLDVAKLHEFRSSEKLDFDHPGAVAPGMRAKRTALPQQLPSLIDIPIPQGLVAPAPAPAAGTATALCDDDPSCIDFPMLNFAEIVRFSPESCIDLSLRFSKADFPWLADRALAGGDTSAYSKTRGGLLIAPSEALLEVMAEAARKLYPGKVVSTILKLETFGFHAVANDLYGIRVQARRLPRQVPDEESVEVVLFDRDSFATETPEKLASCTVVLADAYKNPPEATPLALKAPIRVDWKGEDIYPMRLFAGESCRAIKSVSEIAENGLKAECFVPPRSSLVRATKSPRFSISPIVLASISDALGLLGCREPASGQLHISESCQRLDFFQPQLQEWSAFGIGIFAAPVKTADIHADANAEVKDSDGRLAIRATGLRNRIVRVSPQFHRLLLDPLGDFFSDEVPKASLPTLPHEVICCKIGAIGPDDGDGNFRMRIAANLTLSPGELEKWNELSISDSRRREWLFGRIAAKDAVRKCLMARYRRKIAAADVRIESDEAGKPTPQGEWRKQCGAQMDISITHTTGCVFAAAAPNASLGIDIENRGRSISEEFASSAFSQLEQEIAAESGDGATALLRFWCAKEALSKALGTGLRYGPGDLCARSLDQTTGKVEMEATKLWLKPFPQLRGMLVDVQTCLEGDVILAICALNPGLAKSDGGPFIRWN